MRQVIVSDFGGPEKLRLVESPEPHATSGQVRVKVLAAGLNPVDARIAAGGPTAKRFGIQPPFGNGNDFAGIIDEVGEGAAWSIGDRVYGGARFYAQADFIVIDDLTTLNPTPDELPDEVAGALDIAGRTAVAGVAALQLSPADTVLVSAAAGGVGILAIQIARRTGAKVIAVASKPHHEELRSLDVIPVAYGRGIEEAILKVAPSGVTAVLDCHGVEYVEIGLQLGVRASRINSVADRGAAASVGGLSIGRASTATSAIRPLAELIAAQSMVLPIAQMYPISKVAEAYQRLSHGGRLGKIVLTLA